MVALIIQRIDIFKERYRICRCIRQGFHVVVQETHLCDVCFNPEENQLADQVGKAEGDGENNLLLTNSEVARSR